MRNLYLAFLLCLLIAAGVAGYLTLRSLGFLGGSSVAEVQVVPAGDQEIAWIAPATSNEAWERLVAALRQVAKDYKGLEEGQALILDTSQAFLAITAGVPEVYLRQGISGSPRLLIRWYKVSSEIDAQEWVRRLSRRYPPPLAVIGGDTSDRALTLARALEEHRDQWQGIPPLLLITTATADRYVPGGQVTADLTQDSWPKLVEVYLGRTFRFSFTNTRMAEAVLEFVRQHPEIWLQRGKEIALLAGAVAAPPWPALALLTATPLGRPPFLYTLAWMDDRYSLDLADRFSKVFREKFPQGWANVDNDYVLYGTGDFYQPNPREALAVGLFLAKNFRFQDQPQLLALPTAAQRARRVLRTLCRQAPDEVRHLVVISGDSINFNNVFRDRDLAWNVQDLPVPLIFFSHRDPVATKAGFDPEVAAEGQGLTTATHDLLLNMDIVEALLPAAWTTTGLVSNADQLALGLKETRWGRGRVLPGPSAEGWDEAIPLFDGEGNRHPGTGERVVWLRPVTDNGRTEPRATLSVWYLPNREGGRIWRQFGPLLGVAYDRPGAGGYLIQGD